MEFLNRVLPRTQTGKAALVTVLYGLLAFVAFYFPIDSHATLVMVFGSRTEAREVMTAFVELLFWPVSGLLMVTAGRQCIAHLAAGRRG
jgi:uncharacterized membrane protein HdeD (DUF308 family)